MLDAYLNWTYFGENFPIIDYYISRNPLFKLKKMRETRAKADCVVMEFLKSFVFYSQNRIWIARIQSMHFEARRFIAYFILSVWYLNNYHASRYTAQRKCLYSFCIIVGCTHIANAFALILCESQRSFTSIWLPSVILRFALVSDPTAFWIEKKATERERK